MKTAIAAVLCILAFASRAFAQQSAAPTKEEAAKWSAYALEDQPCKMVTFLLAKTEKSGPDLRKVLGWWGRGYLEGAAFVADLGEKGEEHKNAKKLNEFGVSVDVVAAHLADYCYRHPTETPGDAVHDLFLKVLK